MLKNIIDYIVSHYPESCFAENYKACQSCWEEDQCIQACVDFFYYEKLQWCGCGLPEQAKECIHNYLICQEFFMNNDGPKRSEKYMEHFSVKNVYENSLLLCLAYAMDAAGFTEHGSSISNAWLTDEGKMFLEVLQKEPDYDVLFI